MVYFKTVKYLTLDSFHVRAFMLKGFLANCLCMQESCEMVQFSCW